MAYGGIKFDNITFTNAGVDTNTTVSGIYKAITSGVTVTGTISGTLVQGATVSGTTVTGTAANFASGVFTTQISGTIGIFGAGSATAPGLAVGVGTTYKPGIYSPGTDQLAISTSGTGRLFVAANGTTTIDSGINAYSLYINGTNPYGQVIVFTESGVGRGSIGMGVVVAGTTSQDMAINYNAANNSRPLIFASNATERMRIDSAGNVGIGTSAPGFPLEVVGAIRSSTTVSSSTVSADSDFRLGGASYSRVAHTNSVGGFVGGYNVKFSSGVKHDSTGGMTGIYHDNNAVIRFYTSTTQAADASAPERAQIDSSGRLLVGVSTYGGASNLYPTSNGIIDLGCTVANVPAVLKLGNTGFSNTAEYSTGAVEFRGFDSGGNSIGFASVEGLVTDATSATRKGSIVFKTISASTVSEKVRIDSSGRVVVGTSTANTSGAKLQTSDGLTFPSSQISSADPNTLDDYEEGTWTPTVIGSTVAGTANYTIQAGTYIKIGRQVTAIGAISYASGTGTGDLQVAGIPFVTASTSNSFSYGSCLLDTITTAALNQATIGSNPSESIFRLKQFPIGGGVATTMAYDATGAIYFTITYFTT